MPGAIAESVLLVYVSNAKAAETAVLQCGSWILET